MGIADQVQLGMASLAGSIFRNQRSMRGYALWHSVRLDETTPAPDPRSVPCGTI
jgi:hypothetical protein